MAYKSGTLALGAFAKTDLEGNWHSPKTENCSTEPIWGALCGWEGYLGHR